MDKSSSGTCHRTRAYRRASALLTAAIVASVTRCGDGMEPPRPTSIRLNPSDVTFDALTATQQLSATLLDQNGQAIAADPVTWSSSDATVASVSSTGVVTAVDNGSAEITASSGSLSASATITVSQVVTQLAKTAGDQQTGTVGTALAEAVRVQANDRLGNGVAGQTVNFAVTQGGGSVDAAAGTTDSNGRASTAWTLGTTAGTDHQVDATHANVAGPASFTATATADVPANVAAASGDAQSGPSATPLPDSILVSVTDQFGNGVPGQTVDFTVTAGGGSVSPASVVTNPGRAATEWTLGSALGTNTLEATVGALPPVTFSATSVLGPPTNISASAGDNQTAMINTAVAVPPAVLVTDAGMNPIAGVGVTFAVASGGGNITGPSATTDANGIAAVGSWTLGPVAGTNTLTAMATGVSPFTFTATGTGSGGATSLSINAGDNQTGLVGFAVNVDPAVLVEDVDGNPVSGVSVDFAVTSGGGTLTGSPATTDANGIAMVSEWELGATPGTNTLDAALSGLTPVTFTANGVTSSYDIEVRFIAGTVPTAAQQAAFDAAEAFWEQALFGELVDIPLNVAAGSCGTNSPAINETVDDLLILAEFAAIDGPGGILGQAGPCFIRSTNSLPVMGFMMFDTDDLAALQASGDLAGTIQHEMGHVVGVGTIWGLFGFVINPSVTGGNGVDTHFNGPEAIKAFDAIGGTGYTAGEKVPVENTAVEGQADAHWRESALGTELMTPFLDVGVSNPLSILTTASMLDLGYQANIDAADPFMVSFPITRGAAGRKIEMKNDIWRGPIYVVDSSGRIVAVYQ